MNSHTLAIMHLCRSLEDLAGFVPRTEGELREWYRRARIIEDELVRTNGLSPEVPHFLWHYLADADIRMKDEDYAEFQGRQIHRLLQVLKQGLIPLDEDLIV